MVLVEIVPPDVDVDIDLIYATDANITGRPIYRQPVCLLHPHAAAALRQAVTLAHAQGCRLRVFDAFRPAEAQWRLWEACPDPEFIADPRSGSSHTRGVAVDLTLADAEGRPFDMGTGVDDMTALSHHGNTAVSAVAQANRSRLLGIMAAAGWRHYGAEWWHYQLPDAERYPLLSDRAAGSRLLRHLERA
jgi:D-alanyl-D-alanine dipeptidase